MAIKAKTVEDQGRPYPPFLSITAILPQKNHIILTFGQFVIIVVVWTIYLH